MRDLRDAYRALKATPVITVVAILSLALGIGANTAIFSMLDSLVLRALPVRAPQQLVLVNRTRDGRGASWTNPIWEQIRDRHLLFGGVFAWSGSRFNLAPGGPAELVDGMWASAGLFDVLGVSPILGRAFTPADDRRGGGPDGPVAVISYSFWQRRFRGAADVIGRSLSVERVPFTIVGVTPPDFFGVEVGRTFDVAIPIGTEPLIRGKESALDRRSNWWLNVMIRLKDRQTLAAAETALRGVTPQLREATMPQDWRPQDKDNYLREGFALTPAANGGSGLRQRYRLPLMAMMVVVTLVLLIACANIANLLLARTAARRHELTIRVALGASRGRIGRQLLTESLMLSIAGAGLGLIFAAWGSRLLVRQLSTATNNVFLDLPLDWRVLGFTAAIAGATAIIFGTVPALRGMRVPPNEALKAEGRGIVGQGHLGAGNLLVVLQVAISLVLVVAAGLFVRTFSSLAAVPLGFDRDRILVVNVDAQPAQLDPDERTALFGRVLEAAVGVRGVASAALSAVTPVSGNTWDNRIELLDGPALPENERLTYINLISGDWFRTYGTPLLAGRTFAATDRTGTQPVAIVNETFARKFNYGKNPVGTRVREPGNATRPPVEREIVGYVRDAVYRSLRAPVPPTMHVCAVRTAGDSVGASLDHVPQRARRGWTSCRPDQRVGGRPKAGAWRPGAHVSAARGTGERDVDAGAGRRAALRLLRRAGVAPVGRRPVRRHVLRGEPPEDGNRHPPSARCQPWWRATPRHAARRPPRPGGYRSRHRRQSFGVAFRRHTPVRSGAARPSHSRSGGRGTERDRRDRRMAAGPPCVAARPGAGPQRRLIGPRSGYSRPHSS